jgi:transmembrane sensor
MSKRSTTKEVIPAERLAEAGVWVTRLHSGDRDDAAIAGVKEWLGAHPLNAKALELCTEVFEESENLRRVTTFVDVIPTRARRGRLLVLAVAAAVVTLALVGIFLSPRAGFSTGVGEQRLLNLKDGTHVFLNTDTRIRVEYSSGTRLIELETGEALFDVAKRPDWPFVVRAGGRQVKALGTSFVVRQDAKKTTVTLVEGKVSVMSEALPFTSSESPAEVRKDGTSGKLITLIPGQRLTLVPGNARLDITPLDKAIAWRRGQVVLDDTPLAGAVAEMNRYSSTRLIIEQPEAQTLTVNGLFQAGDSMSFARAVAQTYGFVVVERDDEIILAGSPTRAAQAR